MKQLGSNLYYDYVILSHDNVYSVNDDIRRLNMFKYHPIYMEEVIYKQKQGKDEIRYIVMMGKRRNIAQRIWHYIIG